MKPTLVTSYIHPDLDGISGIIGYAEYLEKNDTPAVAGILGEPQFEAIYMLDRFGVAHPRTIQNADEFDQVVLVDASDRNDLGGMIAPEKITEIIDHRVVHEANAFPNARVQIELVGASATLITEKFMQGTVEPSREVASLLCGGIISNTLNFKASVTTGRDRAAAAWLNRIAGLPEDFWREMFMAKSDVSGERLAQRMRGDSKWYVLNGKRVGITEIEMIGARALVTERADEIIGILADIMKERQLDFIFHNTVELEELRTFLVASDPATQQLLRDAVQATFTGSVAELPYLLMRKEIIPLLKQALG
ncbi:MAG TPA: DHHA2 domain-containing protein [Candidatus Paceibacterota bacterium]|nr:DHHA2 domain-containing protein [Candidatus Paceibacterota bacterium]